MRTPFRIAIAALTAAIALAAASCGGKDSSPTSPGGGGGGGGPSFNFSFPAVGSSNSIAFPNAGTFNYHCTPHQGSGMAGSVIVSSGGAAVDTVEVGPNGTLTFSPSTVTISPGGTVVFVRPATSSFSNHTATR